MANTANPPRSSHAYPLTPPDLPYLLKAANEWSMIATPPSTKRTAPFTKNESSLAKKEQVPAISLESAVRPKGMLLPSFFNPSLPTVSSGIFVLVAPGRDNIATHIIRAVLQSLLKSQLNKPSFRCTVSWSVRQASNTGQGSNTHNASTTLFDPIRNCSLHT